MSIKRLLTVLMITMAMPAKCAGAIIAGGRSSRMGSDKSQLRVKDETLLERAIACLKTADMTPIMISHPDHIPDRVAGRGPLSGVDAILEFASPDITYLVFLPVDMPGVTVQTLKFLRDANSASPCVRIGKNPFPFRLTASQFIADEVRQRLEGGLQLSLLSLQAELGVKELPMPSPSRTEFINVNTQTDLQEFLITEAEHEPSD